MAPERPRPHPEQRRYKPRRARPADHQQQQHQVLGAFAACSAATTAAGPLGSSRNPLQVPTPSPNTTPSSQDREAVAPAPALAPAFPTAPVQVIPPAPLVPRPPPTAPLSSTGPEYLNMGSIQHNPLELPANQSPPIPHPAQHAFSTADRGGEYSIHRFQSPASPEFPDDRWLRPLPGWGPAPSQTPEMVKNPGRSRAKEMLRSLGFDADALEGEIDEEGLLLDLGDDST